MAITQLKCDMHTHTLWTPHAFSTLAENVTSASEAGLEMLGTADHLSPMLRPTVAPEDTLKSFQYFLEYSILPRDWKGVRLLRSAEVDIVDMKGNLFGYDIEITHAINGDVLKEPYLLKDRIFGECDYVIASVHGKDWAEGASAAACTQMYIDALQDPKVVALGHIGRSGLPLDVDALVQAARDMNKLIEINEATLDPNSRVQNGSPCRSVAEKCAEHGCKVMVSTDSHVCTNIGRFYKAVAMLNEIDFPEELVATRNAAAFSSALDDAGLEIL